MIIFNMYEEYEMKCDFCGIYSDRSFDTFEEMTTYMGRKDWGNKRYDRLYHACPDCRVHL